MSNTIPISRVAARRRRFTERSLLCALNPLCDGDTSSMFGVPVPFCHACFNWLPLSWQEGIYRQCLESKGYKYNPAVPSPPSFMALANYTRQIMGIIPARRFTIRNARTQEIIQQPRVITWGVFKVEPRFEFSERHNAAMRNQSSVVKTYNDDRRYSRV